ncbi:MAG: PD-(D/E)XK nuclease family protein [Clostridiales bacterium]|nr:PD-(D/E)XK nuclease family protein [Clostridiales bacterium]
MAAQLEFIIGRSGTGKTRALFERIASVKASGDSSECILIVPEQESFETERSLSEYLKGGLFSCTVASWAGLSRRALDSIGERAAFLSPQGRVMLLRRSADYCEKDLTIFKKTASRRGFPKECDGLISKFKRCGMDAAALGEASSRLPADQPLHDKLADLSVIFADLEKRCRDRYMDPEDMMNAMIARMGETRIRGAHVFIDGGSVMHEQAFPAFAALLSNAASVTAALTVSDSSSGLFLPEERILSRLCDIASKAGVPFKIRELTERKRPGAPALLHLERELYSYPVRPFSGDCSPLTLSVSRSRTDEVEDAAERIRRAAKAGMRYRDMAVIVSDLAGYAPIVSRVFASCGIPCFLDSKRSLVTHPVCRLILSALRAVERGFDLESALEVIRSGFMPISGDEAELLENYLLASGIQGKRLFTPFPEEGAALEDARLRLTEPLSALREEIKGGCSSRARAIHAFMERLGLYEKQQTLCGELHAEGLFREEEENAQVVNTVLEVLDQLFVIMGDEQIGLKRFISVLREGFEAYEVGVIPSTLDQVLIGSMDRTRSREVRLLIVLGMNDGLFPKKRPDDGVIDSGDLEKLGALGYELWRTPESLSEGDRLTVYQALSKATEEIVFSYPLSITGSGAMDTAAIPARLVSDLKRMFPAMRRVDPSLTPLARSDERLAFEQLAQRLRRMIDTGVPDDEAAALYAYFKNRPEYAKALEAATRECFGQPDLPPLGGELAAKLYGRTLYGSASRLEAFNGCPFRHFMQYGVGAKEREERKEKNTELGSFFHEALEGYVKYVMDRGLDWRDIDDEKTFAILREILPDIMYRKGSHVLYDTARQRARLVNLVETIKYTCCAVTRHIARGSFRPEGCEVTFGREDSVFPPLRISSGGAVFFISGIIDRVDAAKTDGGSMRRIIDYKSGGKTFDYGELAAGLQLQLPLYAAAVSAADTVGMYYMPIKDVPPTGDETGEAKKELTEKLLGQFRLSGISLRDEEVMEATEEFDTKSTVISAARTQDGVRGTGLVDGDELTKLIKTAERKAAATLDRILAGEIGVFPARVLKNDKSKKEACRWCPYGDVCRFDPELSRSGWRDVRYIGEDAFFGRE